MPEPSGWLILAAAIVGSTVGGVAGASASSRPLAAPSGPIMFRRADLRPGSLILTGLFIGVIMIGGARLGRRLIEGISETAFLPILEALLILFGLRLLRWPSH